MLVPPKSSSAVLVIISSKSVSSCNHSYARRANGSEITIFRGYPSLMPWFEGNLITQRHKICSQETRDSRLSYGENSESLFHLGLNRYRSARDRRTDRQTDRITIANTRLAVPAVARKNESQARKTVT